MMELTADDASPSGQTTRQRFGRSSASRNDPKCNEVGGFIAESGRSAAFRGGNSGVLGKQTASR